MARLLIAEDEDHIFRMLQFRLTRAGHEVIWASDGGQVLDMAKRELPTVILLDVMMPVMDGFQVLRALKDEPATRSIPVIMLTASSQEVDKVAGISAGAADYITKPFSFQELLARINRFIVSTA